MKLLHRRLRKTRFSKQWQELQTLCGSRKTWPEAVSKADKLLDKALKKRGFKGKTMGEKLVAAQKELNFNEAVWFSHKFSNKLNDGKVDVRKLKKKDVALALAGFREALRDLGALESRND